MCQPTILTDEWQATKVQYLTPGRTITLLGREMRVEYCTKADCGGDFYVLEAYGCHHGHIKDVLSFTIDRNTEVYARL